MAPCDDDTRRDADQDPSCSTDDVCWLCLDGPADKLVVPCRCPGLASHPLCLARWQLQQAGKDEERACRFCHALLPSWADKLLAQAEAEAAGLASTNPDKRFRRGKNTSASLSLPMMLVSHNGIGFAAAVARHGTAIWHRSGSMQLRTGNLLGCNPLMPGAGLERPL